MVETIERIALQCSQCGIHFSSTDRKLIDNPPEKPKCVVCDRLIRLGLQEEK